MSWAVMGVFRGAAQLGKLSVLPLQGSERLVLKLYRIASRPIQHPCSPERPCSTPCRPLNAPTTAKRSRLRSSRQASSRGVLQASAAPKLPSQTQPPPVWVQSSSARASRDKRVSLLRSSRLATPSLRANDSLPESCTRGPGAPLRIFEAPPSSVPRREGQPRK